MNKFVRVGATLRERGTPDTGYKVVLLLGVNKGDQIVDGQWMGYVRNLAVVHPFMFDTRAGSLLYGGDEHGKERTNLAKQFVRVGSMFTLSGASEGEPYEATYEITSIHQYDDDAPVGEERSQIGVHEA